VSERIGRPKTGRRMGEQQLEEADASTQHSLIKLIFLHS
jgi:hypothetical protein